MSVIDLSSIVTYMYTVAHLDARVHNNNWYQTTSSSMEEAAGSNRKTNLFNRQNPRINLHTTQLVVLAAFKPSISVESDIPTEFGTVRPGHPITSGDSTTDRIPTPSLYLSSYPEGITRGPFGTAQIKRYH